MFLINQQVIIMKMKHLFFYFLISLFATTAANAQIKQKIKNIITTEEASDSLITESNSLTDSLRGSDLQQAIDSMSLKLEFSQQKELELQMELEQIRFSMASADSLKRAKQKQRIDSLRATTPGYPVVVDKDTLYYLYTNRGGHAPSQRAKMNEDEILKLGKILTLRPDSLFIEHSDFVSDIMYGDQVILTFTDQDALWAGYDRETYTKNIQAKVITKLHDLKQQFGLWTMIKRVGLLVILIVAQFFLIRGTNWVFRRVRARIRLLQDSKLRPISFHDYEFLDTPKQVKLLIYGASLLRYVLIIIQLLITIPLLFSIFPQTENIAMNLLSYVWFPIRNIFWNIINYIPNLFTILIIYFAIRYTVRFVKYLASEVEEERLNISGFYSDWAQPTFQIIRFLLYAFMVAMVYPYLPGSESGIFQGVSVFVGLIVSLGSTSVIGNIMAGMVMTYMRPFQLGDRIRLDQTVGNVIEKTVFVTRIKTPKNEIVTVPNSFVMSSKTINYSASARNYGLIMHTEICVDFLVPWRKVHELMIEAALETDLVLPDPKPFVLETSLDPSYPIYQINVYIKEVDKQAGILANLLENIIDKFEQNGYDIATPDYVVNNLHHMNKKIDKE